MALQDRQHCYGSVHDEHELKTILDGIAPPSIFDDIKQNKGATWTPSFLVQCAFLWTTCNLPTLTESFAFAFRLFLALQPSYEKTSATFMGFVGQLTKYLSIFRVYKNYFNQKQSFYFFRTTQTTRCC